MLLVTGNLKCNGRRYKADDVLDIELTDREVTSLVDAGVLKVINETRKEDRPVDKAPVNMKAEETKTQAELANMKPSPNWKKPRLLGLAKTKGLAVDESMTRDEIYKLLTGEELPADAKDAEETDEDKKAEETSSESASPSGDEKAGE